MNALGNASGEQNAGAEKLQEAKLNEYNEEVMKLWDKLMSLEVLVVDQLEVWTKFNHDVEYLFLINLFKKEIIKDFERNLSDLVNNFVEQIQGLFSQLRDLENIQFERLQELCLSTLEKVLKGEVTDDFPDDLRDVIKKN